MKQTEQWRKLTKADLKSVDKEMAGLILKAMEVEGCVGRRTTKGHPAVKYNGQTAIFSGTASDHRSTKNGRAQLKRMGLI